MRRTKEEEEKVMVKAENVETVERERERATL